MIKKALVHVLKHAKAFFMSGDLIYHHSILLNDKVRMDAYAAAIKAAVRPGDVVLDLGCGLGVLAFLAAKAGAKKVYAIEYDATSIALAKEFALANGVAAKIKFLKGMSGKLKLPEKVDVILSETFGNVAVNENILPNLLDARVRFLKKGGRIIPEDFTLYAAPVAFAPWQKTLTQLAKIKDLDFSLAGFQTLPLQIRSESIPLKACLAKPQQLARISMLAHRSPQLNLTQDFALSQAGVFCGFAMWFDTTLQSGISFSTAPNAPATHWQQAFLPASEAVALKAKQKIRFYFESIPDSLPAGPINHLAYGYDLL